MRMLITNAKFNTKKLKSEKISYLAMTFNFFSNALDDILNVKILFCYLLSDVSIEIYDNIITFYYLVLKITLGWRARFLFLKC